MKTSQAVVFFGTEHFSAPSLEALITAGYTVSYVVTKPDAARGRSGALVAPEVKTIAIRHNIPVLQPTTLDDIYGTLRKLENPCGILVAYGKIIPQSIIDLFTPGIINVHPSLLPLYRGPSPIEAALLNGDTETGITIMKLSARMDAGPIYLQVPLPLRGTETKPQLYDAFAQKGAELLIDILPNIMHNSITPTDQDDSKATYCSLLKKDDGIMQIDKKSATMLEREVRAFLGFPKSRLMLGDQWIIVTAAHVVTSRESDALVVRCKDDTYLSIDELIAPSGKKMNADAFILGYHPTVS